MATGPSKYEYEPLKPTSCSDGEMRLLTLLPVVISSHISCRLHNVSLNTSRKYEALSYTWGDPKGNNSTASVAGNSNSTHAITLNGSLAVIGYNLEAALQQLRYVDRERVLWVDALCIDQNNNLEKSDQVGAMGQIYENAECVVAWLGEHDNHVDLAFDTLEQTLWALKAATYQRCAQECNLHPTNVTDDILKCFVNLYLFDQDEKFVGHFVEALSLVSLEFDTAPTSLEKLAIHTWGQAAHFVRCMLSSPHRFSELPDLRDRLNAVDQIFYQRNFWQRLWIFQELIHKPTVVMKCGHREMNLMTTDIINHMDYAVLERIFGWGWEKGHTMYTFIDALRLHLLKQYLVTLFRSEKTGHSIATMILNYPHLQCSEPRDAIYAWLNVSRSIDISPSYEMEVADVYSEATKAIIADEGNLNIICALVDKGSSQLQDFALPSWVPHFEGDLNPHDLYRVTVPYDSQYYCAGGDLSSIHCALPIKNSRVLRLHGCFYGAVKEVNESISTAGFEDATLITMARGRLRGMERHISDLEKWRILLADIYHNPSNDYKRLGRISGDAELQAAFESDIKTLSTLGPPPMFIERLRSILSYKSICTTTEENVALVLGDPQVGDRVFVAKGASFPLVLRPVEADGTYDEVKKGHSISTFYELVGGAYVHGIMDGEVREMMNSGHLLEESVFLI